MRKIGSKVGYHTSSTSVRRCAEDSAAMHLEMREGITIFDKIGMCGRESGPCRI